MIRHNSVQFGVLNNKFVTGHIDIVPAHLPQSRSIQCAHVWSAATVLSLGRSFKLTFHKVV